MSRVALVTGGTDGIGAAICVALRNAGFAVAASYGHDDARAEHFRTEHGIQVFKWAVGDFQACRAGVAQVESALGPVDVLVNNAGITRDSTLHKMTLAQWQEVLETNLSGCFNMCRHVIEGMRTRRYGRIVNITSVNGQRGQVGQTNYSASKAGLIGFTRALALESASKGITVNAVAPGYTETPMVAAVPKPVLDQIVAGIPAGRLGLPAEMARAVVFLTAEEAGYINGATIAVNGGLHMG
jgi:acetoacetyl-CoA reductase